MSTLAKILFGGLAIYSVSACVVVVGGNSSSADVQLEEALSLNANDLDTLRIDAGAGKLEIEGVRGLKQIEVQADILTDDNRDYKLELYQRGSKGYLVAESNSGGVSWSGESPKIDVYVRVPANLLLDVDDGSGSLVIKNINNNVILNDGSGSAKIDGIEGSFDIVDGSGSLDIQDVSGDITIKDGSGSLKVVNAGGDVEVDDSSGSINIVNVEGKVTIDDGSGSINVDGAGELVLIDDGSGGTSFTNIRGRVETNE
jgi:hypothetical protein